MMRVILRSTLVLFMVIWLLGVSHSFAQTRDCLYINKKSPSYQLQEIINNIQNLGKQPLPYKHLIKKTDYFVRIVNYDRILTDDKKIKEDASLGGNPFVFLTIPESLYGISLVNLLLDMGYEAEDIVAPGLKAKKCTQEKVAVVFCYPAEITFSEKTDGHLPKNWRDHIYIPTWENIFALFSNLAQKAVIDLSSAPDRNKHPINIMVFQSEAERNRVLGFAQDGKKRIANTTYCLIKAKDDEDWRYRQLLEKKLSIFEHFRGKGRTQNEVLDPKGERLDDGIPEFVGPNQKITDLPEVAVIYLGEVFLSDTYTPANFQHLKKRGVN